MIDKCIEKTVGALIHAYELGLLTEEEIALFERHLLKCEHCVSRIEELSPRLQLMRRDPFVKNEIHHLDNVANPKQSNSVSWKQLLWPDTYFVLKPAILITVILLMIYPSYQGYIDNSESAIGTIQVFDLLPLRSTSNTISHVSDKDNILLSFIYEGSKLGLKYRLDIKDEAGTIIFANDQFQGFDKYGKGVLFIPANLLSSGDYRLIISNPNENSLSRNQEYRFSIFYTN